MKKFPLFWRVLIVVGFTHGVAYAHGYNRGTLAAHNSFEKQLKNVERVRRAPRP